MGQLGQHWLSVCAVASMWSTHTKQLSIRAVPISMSGGLWPEAALQDSMGMNASTVWSTTLESTIRQHHADPVLGITSPVISIYVYWED